MDDSPPPDTNKVGYGRPPEHTKFKKGQSGNPTGKRKPKKSLVEAARHVLQKPVLVRENGKTKKMPYVEAFLESFAAQALTGSAQEKLAFIKLMGLEQFEAALRPDPAEAQRPRTKPVLISPSKEEAEAPIDAPAGAVKRARREEV